MDVKEQVESLVKEAVYRRSQRDYERALASLEQAVQLDPGAPDASIQLGRTLAYYVAEMVTDSKQKGILLDRAEAAIRQAMDKLPQARAECLHDLGWIYDERGDFEAAIEKYREALKVQRAVGTNAKWWPFSYNLACALAKAGRGAEAIETLRPIMKHAWKWASDDSDFGALRDSGEWREPFQKLVEEGRTSDSG